MNLKWVLLAVSLVLLSMTVWLHVDQSTVSSAQSSSQQTINSERQTPDAASIQTLRSWLLSAQEGIPAKGNWCTSGEVIQPCTDLRTKFDYYLMAANRPGTTYSDIRRLIQADANVEAAATSGQIIALFDRYWILQSYAWKQPWLEHDPTTWPAAKAERDRVRQEILGTNWAQVFYAQESQTYLSAVSLTSTQSQTSHQEQITAELSAEEMVKQQWPDLSEEEKSQRVKALNHVMPALSGIQDKSERKILIAQTQWKRLQQEDTLSAADKNAAMKEFIHDSFEPHEYEAVAKVLKIN